MLITHVIRDKGAVVHTLSEAATLEHAAKELELRKVGALVVVDEAGKVTGLLSERDIVRAVARRGAAGLAERVSAVMTKDIITTQPTDTVDDGLALMTDRRIRHLPVMESGRLVGIVSIGDLVKQRIEAVEAEARAMENYIAAR